MRLRREPSQAVNLQFKGVWADGQLQVTERHIVDQQGAHLGAVGRADRLHVSLMSVMVVPASLPGEFACYRACRADKRGVPAAPADERETDRDLADRR